MPSALLRPVLPDRSQPDGPPATSRRLDLDVVRGVAILLALGWHFSPASSGNAVLDAVQWPGHVLGWAGVDLFFVLSGFLMGQIVFREQARTGRFDGRRFTLRRLLRLWPMLYVFLAVQAVIGPEPVSSYLWQNALHVQNYAGSSLSHLWSLAVEEHFYLLLAVLFPLFARRRPSVRVLVGVLVGVLVASLVLRGIGTAADMSDVRLQWRTHFRMDSLAAGLLLAVLRVHAPASFERLQRRRWLWAALTATGVAFLAVVGKGGALGNTLGYTVAYVTGASFLLLLHGAAWVPRAGWLSRPLAALGRYSYGIYIWHLFAAQSVLSWLPGLDYHSTTPLAQAVKFGVAIGAGVLATVVVDRPTLRLRDRLLPATTRVEAGSPAPERSREPATLSARELSADRMAA
jgi:peptidoglycan/LPS O-acetylase OafA/YrhL